MVRNYLVDFKSNLDTIFTTFGLNCKYDIINFTHKHFMKTVSESFVF